MAIVFDEVTAEIAPTPEPSEPRMASQPTERSSPSRSLQEEFQHWQQRESRLRAD